MKPELKHQFGSAAEIEATLRAALLSESSILQQLNRDLYAEREQFIRNLAENLTGELTPTQVQAAFRDAAPLFWVEEVNPKGLQRRVLRALNVEARFRHRVDHRPLSATRFSDEIRTGMHHFRPTLALFLAAVWVSVFGVFLRQIFGIELGDKIIEALVVSGSAVAIAALVLDVVALYILTLIDLFEEVGNSVGKGLELLFLLRRAKLDKEAWQRWSKREKFVSTVSFFGLASIVLLLSGLVLLTLSETAIAPLLISASVLFAFTIFWLLIGSLLNANIIVPKTTPQVA